MMKKRSRNQHLELYLDVDSGSRREIEMTLEYFPVKKRKLDFGIFCRINREMRMRSARLRYPFLSSWMPSYGILHYVGPLERI